MFVLLKINFFKNQRMSFIMVSCENSLFKETPYEFHTYFSRENSNFQFTTRKCFIRVPLGIQIFQEIPVCVSYGFLWKTNSSGNPRMSFIRCSGENLFIRKTPYEFHRRAVLKTNLKNPKTIFQNHILNIIKSTFKTP